MVPGKNGTGLAIIAKTGRHPNERNHINEEGNNPSIPHITQRVARAKILRQDVIRRGPRLECLRCGQFWESAASSMIFSEGMCPGPRLYGPPQKKRPWVIQAAELNWAGPGWVAQKTRLGPNIQAGSQNQFSGNPGRALYILAYLKELNALTDFENHDFGNLKIEFGCRSRYE